MTIETIFALLVVALVAAPGVRALVRTFRDEGGCDGCSGKSEGGCDNCSAVGKMIADMEAAAQAGSSDGAPKRATQQG